VKLYYAKTNTSPFMYHLLSAYKEFAEAEKNLPPPSSSELSWLISYSGEPYYKTVPWRRRHIDHL